jgi:hypothetical protein
MALLFPGDGHRVYSAAGGIRGRVHLDGGTEGVAKLLVGEVLRVQPIYQPGKGVRAEERRDEHGFLGRGDLTLVRRRDKIQSGDDGAWVNLR